MTVVDAEWDPRAEEDKLGTLAELMAAMHHGRPALERRLAELAGGYSTAGGSGSGEPKQENAEEAGVKLTRTEAGAQSAMEGQQDTAKREREAWERELDRTLREAARVWERYRRLVQPRDGVEKLADPGCELCAKVEGHWCPVYGAKAILIEPVSKKGRAKVRVVTLCQWCLQFTWPSRAGRLPQHEEVVAHAEGRKVRWRGGTEPQLVEVACPECKDENRQARRACSMCGHSGKVLKSVPA